MTDEPAITREVRGAKGRYALRRGDEVAKLTFTVVSPSRIIADHTYVPESFRGSGAGRALVDRMIADARAEGFTILPHCPYVKAQRQKHPEWDDVFTE